MLRTVGLALGALVAMEPATYAAHRWLMHGVGMILHRSHHRWSGDAGRFEANDGFPLAFGSLTVAVMFAGYHAPALAWALPVTAGISAYGTAYLFVHDVYIHGRVGRLREWAPLEYLREAHRIHHLFGGEPYGMLCPIVSRDLRARAATTTRDPIAARIGTISS